MIGRPNHVLDGDWCFADVQHQQVSTNVMCKDAKNEYVGTF